MEWILASIPYFKVAHITSLFVWCGGLLALPLMLRRHDPGNSRDQFLMIHHVTHQTYIALITPAAVVAVISGTWLMLLRQTFEPWFYAKLVVISLLVMGHAWIGHILVEARRSHGNKPVARPFVPLTVLLASMAAILFLVLGKPRLEGITMPAGLVETQGRQLPFEVPRR
jgi:protoporphyrinogen IX oxidase